MVRALAEFENHTIYLDTMILYALSRGIDASTRDFFQRIESGAIQAFTSVLTFDELAYRLLLAAIKDHYPGSPLDHLRTQEKKLLIEFAPAIGKYLEALRSFPNLIVSDLLALDLGEMIEAMQIYRLRPRDALHLAKMKRLGCYDLASNDSHFDSIPGLRRFHLP